MSETCKKGHWTIRLARQPCPHPECWRGGTTLVEPMLDPSPSTDWSADVVVLVAVNYTERRSVLRRIRHDNGSETWAWVAP